MLIKLVGVFLLKSKEILSLKLQVTLHVFDVGRSVHIPIDGLLRSQWNVITLVHILPNSCHLLDLWWKENV